MIEGRELVQLIAEKADEKKAGDIKILDMEGVSLLADYMIVCSGNTAIQVRAIAQHINEELKKLDQKIYGLEGMSEGHWVLLDFGTVIVHVMRAEEREFYNLERLWSQSRIETWEPTPSGQ